MRGFVCGLFLSIAAISVAEASQTYVPPPPPQLPAQLSEEMVFKGQRLFEENILPEGPVQIHNFLGSKACGECHDSPTPLKSEDLSKGFRDIRSKINDEIQKRGDGSPLPPQDPAMEALVQYLVKKYRLHEYKLLK